MSHSLPVPAAASVDADLSPWLKSALAQASVPDPVETVAAFGRWWFDPHAGHWLLSTGAARLLGVTPGLHPSAQRCFAQVVPDDVVTLLAALDRATDPPCECEFRIIDAYEGLRWLRLVALPHFLPRHALQTGVLLDVTAARHAAMRERFSFESTRFLVGSDSLGQAITQMIRLVCENLGWDWGAYWALEPDPMGAHQLGCQYYWHPPAHPLPAFTAESRTLRIAPGQGLVGNVWRSAQACWVEDIVTDHSFLRRRTALDCGLRSGYAFPVSYVTAEGYRHSPGVMEFFSTVSRQREAQLPNLSAQIGALVAQTIQRLEQQDYIRQLAQVDDLTGLANRNHFHHLLESACLNATRTGMAFGVLFIDLDRFKPINDAFGHDAGNVVLREFAQRLTRLALDDSTVGRLGGDEFAILINSAASLAQVRALAERVLLAARRPFLFGEHELTVSASVGISVFPEHGGTPAELMRNADAAMYRSKQNGRNALSFFADTSSGETLAEQQSILARQLTMEAELHHALVGNQLYLDYQPVFEAGHGRMRAVEALVRWRRPDGEIVPPDVFIPIAEQSRLIKQIGRWVVGQACHDLARLHQAGFTDLTVNVNMAASEFMTASLPGELTAMAGACGLAPRHLCLELTESMVMKQPDKVIPVMRTLRQLGFRISLDDFGIGHSSLSRLKHLPISSLKIDRSFVRGLPHDRGDGAIVRTILDLGRHMQLQVIAEGVETDAQLGFLRQFGCPLLQGFVLGRPASVEALIRDYPPEPGS